MQMMVQAIRELCTAWMCAVGDAEERRTEHERGQKINKLDMVERGCPSAYCSTMGRCAERQRILAWIQTSCSNRKEVSLLLRRS